jgi:hypothetical protein
MKKYVGFILVAIAFSAIMTPVFAIRMIDFISQRNGVAINTPQTDINSVQPAPDPDPNYDWKTPFIAYVKIKATGGTVNLLDGLSIDTITPGYPKLQLKLFTYQGNTKLYGPSTIYIKGKLTNGDIFSASIVIPNQNVEMMSFTEDDIWFNATEKKSTAFIYNLNTKEKSYPVLDTVRCHITGGLGGNVNCAAGNGGEQSNYTYISGMTVDTFVYDPTY